MLISIIIVLLKSNDTAPDADNTQYSRGPETSAMFLPILIEVRIPFLNNPIPEIEEARLLLPTITRYNSD